MDDISVISNLLLKHLQNDLTAGEAATLNQWRAESPANEQLFEELTNGTTLQPQFSSYYKYRKQTNKRLEQAMKVARVTRIRQWVRYAAAIIVVVGLGSYLLLTSKRSPSGMTSGEVAQAKATNIPGANKATLTLADGSKIILDNTQTGNIAQQGGTNIIKLDGNQLAYSQNLEGLNVESAEPPDSKPSRFKATEGLISYNTITTPAGGQYQITLPDGTKVWLNALSSVKFPVAFTGAKREITLTGEAYFEVKKDAQKSFSVKVNNLARIDVIGTSFNVNAYEEERFFKASLLEGSVRVTLRPFGSAQGGSGLILSPGQAYANGKVVATDLEQDLAWKNGLFRFDNVTIEPIMRELSRWYGLKIEYRGKVTDRFVSTIPRNAPLSQVLRTLELAGGVHFIMEGNKVTVTP